MKSKYWSSVGNRLVSMGKTILNMAAPVAVDIGITKAVEKACSLVENKLKEMYIRTGINTAISFSINLAGVLILIFKPFGQTASRYVTYGFFSASFIFFLVRMILFIKNYGKTTLEVSKKVLNKKSVYKGIEQYVLTEFPVISLGYTGIAIAAEFVPSLKEIPKISELVKYMVSIFWKRLALFVGIVAVYTITVFWIVKPILVKVYF